eukprot:gnl/Chilomastix_caulleri/1529.p1 GENE.gnl/Chilomastix_caulleri/1529~~gnl/Chilomastix_caulleri/1529.p1  ORF type:complete len:57 (+),score=8.02 gnl/Chilomastix_caulleri/1529:25-171(+)
MDLTALSGVNTGDEYTAIHGIKPDSPTVNKKHNIIHIRIKRKKAYYFN